MKNLLNNVVFKPRSHVNYQLREKIEFRCYHSSYIVFYYEVRGKCKLTGQNRILKALRTYAMKLKVHIHTLY